MSIIGALTSKVKSVIQPGTTHVEKKALPPNPFQNPALRGSPSPVDSFEAGGRPKTSPGGHAHSFKDTFVGATQTGVDLLGGVGQKITGLAEDVGQKITGLSKGAGELISELGGSSPESEVESESEVDPESELDPESEVESESEVDPESELDPESESAELEPALEVPLKIAERRGTPRDFVKDLADKQP